ncbi:hypothetical protein I307_03718 [Cryptococcus deuterogattii 99/473]|uniref:Uncharacterized protein n=2 Tax=Cryptococcus deuterogattii TaxID=1859096 RepID=A0A0D0TAY1_9TREE|nr:hypothetical protein I309_00745 [Cryptococcus deuterogattii LA55]KIR36731.1 hypothetical protein I352_00042 [Cryptococcus deuterogattii MMRL2647]KIR43202.1 hypothetical protein I313_00043 [Cryptococcus deuterogattii Ram5]KIR69758.1 hypothetical protein I310_06482 [Cryptococcus deuterogattii CA1014]KIR92538.1 hypothetical protein I304_03943 [Cryptococcus deuterogattii CBS 10090]KIS01704.1 hypothetical protein L804_01583 [Cryptococcus deuterogattii 2001/935-1]KIY56980.1 hypothetical protein 
MGNRQSQQPAPRHHFNGPLFGGHYPGDFSIRGRGMPDLNKALPPLPNSKKTRFGSDPPPWIFYKHRPPDENLANTTRYCSPGALYPEAPPEQKISPPPAYGTWNDEKRGMTARKKNH